MQYVDAIQYHRMSTHRKFSTNILFVCIYLSEENFMKNAKAVEEALSPLEEQIMKEVMARWAHTYIEIGGLELDSNIDIT